MNERAKELVNAITAYLSGGGLFNPELAEQAGVFVGDFAGAGLYSIHNKDEVEKFAELLIRECAPFVGDLDSTAVKEFFNHFGVEE